MKSRMDCDKYLYEYAIRICSAFALSWPHSCERLNKRSKSSIHRKSVILDWFRTHNQEKMSSNEKIIWNNCRRSSFTTPKFALQPAGNQSTDNPFLNNWYKRSVFSIGWHFPIWTKSIHQKLAWQHKALARHDIYNWILYVVRGRLIRCERERYNSITTTTNYEGNYKRPRYHGRNKRWCGKKTKPIWVWNSVQMIQKSTTNKFCTGHDRRQMIGGWTRLLQRWSGKNIRSNHESVQRWKQQQQQQNNLR